MLVVGAKEPIFELVGSFFKVTLYPINGRASEGVSEGVNEGVNEGVSEGVEALHMLIIESRGKRTPFFSKKLGTSEKNIERWLKQLKEAGKIEFRGAPKTGGYYSTGDDNQ
jgi:ATP-dependent DNA helicase RecG